MRRALRCVLVVGVILTALAGGGPTAQDRPADLMDVVREKARADKKLLVATALELTETEAKSFWPVYNAYQSDMIVHHDRLLELVRTYAGAWDSMSDDGAATILSQYLALQGEHAALLQAYAPRFQRVLPARKTLRLYQVENKLRAILLYDLAREIPLVK